MATTPLDRMLARLVVQQRLVVQDNINVLLRAQDTHSDAPLSGLLVESGVLSAEQVATLLPQAKALLAQEVAARASRPAPPAAPPAAPTAAPPAPQPSPGARPAPPRTLRPAVRPGVAPPKSAAVILPPRAAPSPAEPVRPAPAPSVPPQKAPQGLSVLARVAEPTAPTPAAAAELVDLDLFAVEEEPAPPPPPPVEYMELPDGDGPPQEEMELILRVAGDMAVSDLHLFAGHKVVVRQHGKLLEQPTGVFSSAKVERLVRALLTPAQAEMFEQRGELDFACTIANGWRFRANVYRHQRGVSAMFRPIPARPPLLAQLGLPASLGMLAGLRNGLVLFTGPSGCGKSSSMAALVHAINSTRADNIVTMEDPIEFLHEPIMASIIQRQVGAHTQGFASALHAALREDPDVIVVGELRDLETIQLALTAAETGHLVLATLHTNNAARSINRIIAAYPQNQQEQVRAMLADGLRAVLSQRLLPTQDQPGRVVAAELLLVNRAVQNLIRENKTLQLRTLIQTSASEGMVLLDQSLAVLVQTGRVSAQEALRYAEDPRRIPAAGG